MRKSQSGLTLIEVMVTIAVMVVILTIGIPSFNSVIEQNRATVAANDLLGSLQLARSEAVRLNEPVTITPSNGWSGWKVEYTVESTDENGKPIVKSIVLRERSGVNATISNTLNLNSLEFLPTGRLAEGTATFKVKVSNAAVRCVSVAITGASQVKQDGC